MPLTAPSAAPYAGGGSAVLAILSYVRSPFIYVVVSTLDYLGRCPALHGAVPGLERPVLAQLVVEEELLVVEGARGDEHLRGNSELGQLAPPQCLLTYIHTY